MLDMMKRHEIQVVRRVEELRAKLAELEAGLPSPERTCLAAQEVAVARGPGAFVTPSR